MKFSINTKELVRVLSNIQGIIDKTGQNQLSYVFLQAVDSKLILNATNNQLTLVDSIDATVEEEGVICVKAHRLLQVMKSLSGAITTISLRHLRLTVSSGQAQFNIKECNPTDDFPPYDPPRSDLNISIGNNILRRMLLETVFSIMKPERADLNGAHIEIVNKEEESFLRMVTTDGNRLSISEGIFDGNIDESSIQKMLLPQKALQELLNLTGSYNEQLWKITFGQRKACFSIEELEFSFSLIDGNFPDYKTIFKKLSTSKKVQIEKKSFTSVLRRVGVFHSKNSSSVMFSFEDENLEVSIKNSDMGDFKEEISVNYEGGSLSISFNLGFFQELLSALDAEHIQLEMDNPMSPCLITVPDRNDCKFVIMPMRHNS